MQLVFSLNSQNPFLEEKNLKTVQKKRGGAKFDIRRAPAKRPAGGAARRVAAPSHSRPYLVRIYRLSRVAIQYSDRKYSSPPAALPGERHLIAGGGRMRAHRPQLRGSTRNSGSICHCRPKLQSIATVRKPNHLAMLPIAFSKHLHNGFPFWFAFG